MDIYNYIIVGGVLILILFQINMRQTSPIYYIFHRWFRLLLFSFALGLFLQDSFLPDRPLWSLILLGALLWFLVESIYNWLAIMAMSESPMPLFPRYSLNPAGDEWPVGKQALELRNWLRNENFKPVQALRAELAPSLYLRMSVFEQPDQNLRIQLLFFPQPQGAVCIYCVLLSQLASGERVMTDNLHVPYGGFYPENWFVERSPWTRSPKSLITRHKQRLAKLASATIPFEHSPLSDVDQSQRELERLNTEMGFLFPQPEREEFGKITQEGRFRVWTEIWLLNYFGRSGRYS